MVLAVADGIVGLRGSDKICGDDAGALVDELVEGVLAVGTGLAPNDRSGAVVHLEDELMNLVL